MLYFNEYATEQDITGLKLVKKKNTLRFNLHNTIERQSYLFS